MSGTRLGGHTWPELVGRRPVLLVPIGSTEQHGPHLPLDTDTRVAVAVAEGAAGLLVGEGIDTVVAPAVPYGSSGEHQGFPGTISIGQDAVELLVTELVRSARTDHSPVILVNGHGGNAVGLARAVAVVRHEEPAVQVWSPRLPGADSHAGRVETSLMLAIDPDAVDLARARAGVTTPLGELIDELRAGGLAAVTPNGVLGDPTGASADEGRGLLAGLVEDLRSAVVALLAGEDPGAGPPPSGASRAGAATRGGA